MFTIEKSRTVQASVDAVWDIVSDLKTETDYWSTIREIRIISRNGNRIEREATVGPWAFGIKSMQTLIFEGRDKIRLTITGTRMDGERTIYLVPKNPDVTEIRVVWKMEPKDVPNFVPAIMESHINNVTEHALLRISEEAQELEKASTARGSSH